MYYSHMYEYKVGAVFGHFSASIWKRYLHHGAHRVMKKTVMQKVLGW